MFINLMTLILMIFEFVSTPIQTAEVRCNRKTEVQMDNALTKLLVVGQKNTKFPVNEKELRPYCNHALRTFDMISTFSGKCLPKFGRESAAIIMHSINLELKSICRSGRLNKRARELLNAAPCANAGLDRWQKCNLKIIEKFTGILNADVKLRIPMGCCNYHALVKCLVEEAEEVKACTRRTVDFVVKYVSKVVEPLLVLLCTQYDESNQQCDKLVQQTPNRTSRQKKYRSVLLPTINIAMSLGDQF